MRSSLLRSTVVVCVLVAAVVTPACSSKIGIIISDWGEADSCDQVESFTKAVMASPVIDQDSIPPEIFADMIWATDGGDIMAEYLTFNCDTKFTANTVARASVMDSYLSSLGYNVKTYVGWLYTSPFLEDVMLQAKEDGVDTFYITTPEVQYSTLIGELAWNSSRDIAKKYNWSDVHIYGIPTYYDDIDYNTFLQQWITNGISNSFPSVDPSKICVLLTAHGVPESDTLVDPWVNQTLYTFDQANTALTELGYSVYFGWQNHGVLWTQPTDMDQAKEIGKALCPYAVISGAITFTVDCSETLYDGVYAQRGQILAVNPKKQVSVLPNFNDDSAWATLVGAIMADFISGQKPVVLVF
ncbi:protoporphyrin/coproporphyrin ferrochelatase [Pelomyxa schiedti]|nr:protoporphyrin/coproporphyrin ferrochelatase [Pelomyxa schiedti]